MTAGLLLIMENLFHCGTAAFTQVKDLDSSVITALISVANYLYIQGWMSQF